MMGKQSGGCYSSEYGVLLPLKLPVPEASALAAFFSQSCQSKFGPVANQIEMSKCEE